MRHNTKLVIDTNVIVSASLFSQSKPRQALDRAQDIGIVLLSESVLAEIKDVLFRPKLDRYISREMREDFLVKFVDSTQLIPVTETINECRDPKIINF